MGCTVAPPTEYDRTVHARGDAALCYINLTTCFNMHFAFAILVYIFVHISVYFICYLLNAAGVWSTEIFNLPCDCV